MNSPALADLSVYRGGADAGLDYYEVHSWLTRGRCAEVAVSRCDAQRVHVRPFLIPSYMQGISHGLIVDAVKDFIEKKGQRA